MTSTQPYAGYLFAYFTGEDHPDGEQVHLALSRGDDPVRYDDLNGGRPVLRSTLGEGGVRDPFLLRAPGGGFYLLATDLRIHGRGDWDAAVRTGSRSIVVWESPDLVSWSGPRSVVVSPATAGNTWAPEALWDAGLGRFVVYWASSLYEPDDAGHTGASHHRMMVATTEDFVTFSPAQVWNDPGHSVIDSTVVVDDGWYYRFTKDEREPAASTPTSKFILAERSTDLLASRWEPVTEGIGRASDLGPGLERGEGPAVVRANDGGRWYLFIDEFGLRGYVPFTATDLAAERWTMVTDHAMPSRARHGSVLPVTRSEHDALMAAFGAGAS
jgi:hypothetical protein